MVGRARQLVGAGQQGRLGDEIGGASSRLQQTRGEAVRAMSKEGKSDQLEVERKFLLPEPPPWLGDHPSIAIAQGYIVIDDEVEVRLRAADQHRMLTVKRGHGESREEIEVQLSAEQFDALWPLTESLRLRKRRFRVPVDGLTAEVDVFEGELEGLVTGEVEFESIGAAERFEAPPWLGQEVTGDERYANQTPRPVGPPGGRCKSTRWHRCATIGKARGDVQQNPKSPGTRRGGPQGPDRRRNADGGGRRTGREGRGGGAALQRRWQRPLARLPAEDPREAEAGDPPHRPRPRPGCARAARGCWRRGGARSPQGPEEAALAAAPGSRRAGRGLLLGREQALPRRRPAAFRSP